MNELDWIVVTAYLAGMLGLSAWVGRGQRSRKDYYLGGNSMRPLPLATSTIATQCSTNSLLGAPAFVGFVAGGGMIWLQYELAVPLAMLALMLLLSPMRRLGYISAYEFLQDRLGTPARIVASASFLVFRGVATGVTVYGVSLVLMLLIDVDYLQAVLILMGVTVVYDVIGGMRAVVISDVIQVLLIVAAVAASLVMLTSSLGGVDPLFQGRTEALNPSWGLVDADSYGFWPMLIGGFFLYMAYYGCDQSQAQRVLAARSEGDANRVLLLNGLLRFPLVLLYCVLGLALAAYASVDGSFVTALPTTEDGAPNFNLVFPTYVLGNFAPGVVGLVMAGILAAAMSSIDSALNSLSATTVEDYVDRRGRMSERTLFVASKLATVGWGLFAVAFSFQVERIAPTVLEAINKIGSVVNGPLLALFLVAAFFPAAGASRAVAGFFVGVAGNCVLWLWFPVVSWLWWNVAGCLVALAISLIGSGARLTLPSRRPARGDVVRLVSMAAGIFTVCVAFQTLAR